MPPKFGQLKKYCENTKWTLTRNTDHWYYQKVLASGEVLRTKVSHAVAKEIPANLWRFILSKQLKISEQDFYKHI